MFKKLTLFSLIVVLFISFINTNFAYATPQDKINESLKKYQTLDSEILELNSKIESLDIEIDKTTLKLKENNQAISDIKSQIEINESKLKQTKEEIEKAQIVLDNRVRTMYKTNMSSNILVSVITSKNITDLFSRVQAISKILSTDKEILSDINNKKNELDLTIKNLNTKNIKNGFIWLGLDKFYNSEYKCIDAYKMNFNIPFSEAIEKSEHLDLDNEDEAKEYDAMIQRIDTLPIISISKMLKQKEDTYFATGKCVLL